MKEIRINMNNKQQQVPSSQMYLMMKEEKQQLERVNEALIDKV